MNNNLLHQNAVETNATTKKPIPVGSTWTNSGSINIDLDNLMGKKDNKGQQLSMNQLKSVNSSPVHPQQKTPMVMSPTGILSPTAPQNAMGKQFMFNAPNQPQTGFNSFQQNSLGFLGTPENNNNFNQFNAFQ